jgi:hypothetical protein
MEFRYPYMVALQEQKPKMYRRLRYSGELDRYVNLKTQEACRLAGSRRPPAPRWRHYN